MVMATVTAITTGPVGIDGSRDRRPIRL
jgi:hypothetical protein